MSAGLVRRLATSWLPPILADVARRRFGTRLVGEFTDWPSAQEQCGFGYGEDSVIEHLEGAARGVLNGNYAWERDGFSFSDPSPDWRLIALVQRAATQIDGEVHVVDFGGGLASAWLRNRQWLPAALRWTVVEQPKLVAVGKRLFSEDRPTFVESVEEAAAIGQPHILVFGSVLQYLEHPWQVLEQALSAKPWGLLVDRTPFSQLAERDAIVIQQVPASLGGARYPAWVFAHQPFQTRLNQHWRLLADEETPDRCNRRDVCYRAMAWWRAEAGT